MIGFGFGPGPGNTSGPPPRSQTDPRNDPQAFQKLAGMSLSYASQANGLTPSEQVAIGRPVRVLNANQEFFDHWKGVAESHPIQPPPPQLALMLPPGESKHYAHTQIASDRVRVLSPSTSNLVHRNGSSLEGDPNVLSAFETSLRVDDAATGFLGRSPRYRSGDGQLHVHVNTPNELDAHYVPGTGSIALGKPLSVPDPDVVAHEQGHALMDAVRPGLNSKDVRTTAASEGFADGVAIVNAFSSRDVRADALKNWGAGKNSGLASNLAEGYHREFARLADEKAPPAGEGLRDLGQPAPRTGLEKDDGHEASRQFGSAVYNSIRDLTGDIRKKHPDMSADEALQQARHAVGSDLHRALEFLPNTNVTSQDVLAEAMMKAGQLDRSGSSRDIYLKNFQGSGLAVKGQLGQDVSKLAGLQAPANLQDYELSFKPGVPTGKKNEFGVEEFTPATPIHTDSSKAMQAFLTQNGSALGIPKGMMVESITHNAHGEVQVLAQQIPTVASMPEVQVGQGMVLHFDAQGKINYLNVASREARERFIPQLHR